MEPLQSDSLPADAEALRRDWRPALKEILHLAGTTHPIISRRLARDVRALWDALGIPDPLPRIDDAERRARAYERVRRQRGRKRHPLTVSLWRR